MAELSYKFPRSHRLGGRQRFGAVYNARVKESRGPLTIFVIPNGLGPSRLGISISRKVGTAVRRNQIKRLLRESFRLLQYDLPRGYDAVIVVRPHEPLELADYQEIMKIVIEKLHRIWTKKKSAEC